MEPKDFPNRVLLRGFEGGAVYTAERDGKYFVIQDESAVLSLLDQADAAGFEAQKVLEFPTGRRGRDARASFPAGLADDPGGDAR